MSYVIFAAVLIACILLTRNVALRKGRDANYWTVVSCLLGPLALLAVLVLPRKR